MCYSAFKLKADGNKFLIGHFAHLFDHFDITPQLTTLLKALTKNVSEKMRSEFSPERYLFKGVPYNVGVFHINLKVVELIFSLFNGFAGVIGLTSSVVQLFRRFSFN